jgi:hypothetical protein
MRDGRAHDPSSPSLCFPSYPSSPSRAPSQSSLPIRPLAAVGLNERQWRTIRRARAGRWCRVDLAPGHDERQALRAA